MNAPPIDYQGGELPGPPLRPEEEPDFGPDLFATIGVARTEEAEIERFEVLKLMRFWKSQRPVMWRRLCLVKLARRYASRLLADEARSIEQGRSAGLIASEAIMEFGDDGWWKTPEKYEYDSELEKWSDRVSAMGLDPKRVLAEVEGRKGVGDETESSYGGIESK